jgi:hypothetical protein
MFSKEVWRQQSNKAHGMGFSVYMTRHTLNLTEGYSACVIWTRWFRLLMVGFEMRLTSCVTCWQGGCLLFLRRLIPTMVYPWSVLAHSLPILVILRVSRLITAWYFNHLCIPTPVCVPFTLLTGLYGRVTLLSNILKANYVKLKHFVTSKLTRSWEYIVWLPV